MTATSQYLITEINGYEVQIYNTYDGDVVYIVKDGIKIDDFRTIKGEGLLRATEKVASFSTVVSEETKHSEAGYDLDKLVQAKTQLVGYFVTFHAADLGSRWLSALEKAHTELLENDSILFDGQRLVFTSRTSKKQRIVTKFGCSDQCQCGGLVSYHFALFQLISRYNKLLNNVRTFPVREVRQVPMAA